MDIYLIIMTLLGLILFEIINSVDNAIINAEVLQMMSDRARKLFLVVGIFTAVFVVRGTLPWIIVWSSNPALGVEGALKASFSSDPGIIAALAKSAPLLLIGGGVFLILLALHWVFLEEKNKYFKFLEKARSKPGLFYLSSFLLLAFLVWKSLRLNPRMALAAIIGASVFFITQVVKARSEKYASDLKTSMHISDIGKIVYLEMIDASFSIDGVLGAFAFTLAVPLILIGNGIGALIVRKLTLSNINRISQFRYLKNGAMYSIFALGIIMILDSFGLNVPGWASPAATFSIVGIFMYSSVQYNKKAHI